MDMGFSGTCIVERLSRERVLVTVIEPQARLFA